jgi:iron complex outermembrane receptor protein
MSTKLRNNGATSYKTNHMKSSIWGTKLKNKMKIADSLVTLGIDTSVRNWKGDSYMTNVSSGVVTMPNVTLASTDTTNKALFAKVEKSFGNLKIETGVRYDYTDIESEDSTKTDRNYNSLNANIFAVYKADQDTKYFAGIGKSSRVPDARELYYDTSNNNLDDTKNYEADLGFEKNIGNFNIKTKLFYSELKDYIYNTGTFTNIDATIYGLDVSGFYMMSDSFSLDYGAAYQRGKKDGDFADKDLAEVTPLKTNIALNYEVNNAKFTTEVVAVDRWDNYDGSAAEQELAGYALVNLKYTNQLRKNFGFTVGVDNLFNKTYASTNTYQDVTYVVTGGESVLLNDPGRYGYVNLKFSF